MSSNMTHPCPKCEELERRLQVARETLERVDSYIIHGSLGQQAEALLDIRTALHRLDAPYEEVNRTLKTVEERVEYIRPEWELTKKTARQYPCSDPVKLEAKLRLKGALSFEDCLTLLSLIKTDRAHLKFIMDGEKDVLS